MLNVQCNTIYAVLLYYTIRILSLLSYSQRRLLEIASLC